MLNCVRISLRIQIYLAAGAALLLVICPTAGADVVNPGYADLDSRKSALLSGKYFVTAERRSKVTNIIRTDTSTGERRTIYRLQTGSRLVSYSAGGNSVLLVQSRTTSPRGVSPRAVTDTATLMNNDGSNQRLVATTRMFQHSKYYCGTGIDWGAVHADQSVLISKVKYFRLDGKGRQPCLGDDGRPHAPRYGFRLTRLDTNTGATIHHNLFLHPGMPAETARQFSPNGRLFATKTKRGWRLQNLVTGQVVFRRLPKRFADVSSVTISDDGAMAFAVYLPDRFRGDTTIHTSQVLFPNILESYNYREFAFKDDPQDVGRFCGRQYVTNHTAWPLQLIGHDVGNPEMTSTYSFPTPSDSYQYRVDCDSKNLFLDVRQIGGMPSRHLKPLTP